MDSKPAFADLDFIDFVEIREDLLKDLEQRTSQAPIDICDALASFLPKADDFQKKVIESTESTIRVVAAAGSGKTQTVINRVLIRIRNGLNPARILVLTFDKAAVSSLKTQLQHRLANLNTNIEGLQISTLNSFGYRFLREHIPKEYKPIIREFRQRRLFKEVMDALKNKSATRFATLPSNLDIRFFLDYFSFLKNELFDPRNIHPQKLTNFILEKTQSEPFFPVPHNRKLVTNTIQAMIWLFMAHEKAMQRNNFIDFDDQKLRSYVELSSNPSLLDAIQSQFSEVIVDEFQDINKLDFVFIKALAEKSVLVVTGDDDQAIYGFRGCSPDFIINLEKYLDRDFSSYELQVNYRCPINIIHHANKLIKHNKNRIEKNPIVHNEKKSEIIVLPTLSAGLEAKSIVSYIKRLKKAKSDLNYKDMVVLYRTNAQSFPIQIEFILNYIPYYVREDDNILSNEILERLLGALRLKLALAAEKKPTIKDSIYAIRAYFRYLDGRAVERLSYLFQRNGNFVDTIASDEFYSILPKAKKSYLIPAVIEMLDKKSLLDTLDVLSKRFNGLRGMIGSLEDVINERVPLGEIFEVAANFKGNINDFVTTMEQAINLAHKSGAGKDQETGIKLLTYFKSKGLQWHTVFLTTCNEGLIPHKRARIEDERRLFYVAMTRASSNLLISYVSYSCKNKVAPSRFLLESGLL